MKKTKFYCLFEQSGTFKNEIKKLGGGAKEFDILNDYGQTDCVIDLYNQIDRAYWDVNSIFDKINSDDYILAFFPCTRFENQINMQMLGNSKQQKKWSDEKNLKYNQYLTEGLERNYQVISRLVLICMRRNLRCIIENPAGGCHYLTRNWNIKPKVIDNNRKLNGDYYKKPTQFFFINCEPKNNNIEPLTEAVEDRKDIGHVFSQVERSEISPVYANRFLRRYIAEYKNGEYIL